MPGTRLDRRRPAGAPYAAPAGRQNGGRCNVPALPFGEILRGARQARATFPTASATRAPLRGSAGSPRHRGVQEAGRTARQEATSPPGAPWLSPATAAAIPPWPSSWQGSTAPRRPVPVRHAAAGAPGEQPLRKAPEGPAVLRKIRGAPPSLAGAGAFCATSPRRTARGMHGLRTPAYPGGALIRPRRAAPRRAAPRRAGSPPSRHSRPALKRVIACGDGG